MKRMINALAALFLAPALWAQSSGYAPQYGGSSSSAQTPAAQNQDYNSTPNRQTGYYAELNAGTNLAYLAIFSSSGSDQWNNSSGVALSAAFGKMFKPSFGVEGGYMYSHIAGVDDDEIETFNIPYVAARFAKPLGDHFSLFAKVGVMVPVYVENHEDKDDETHMIVLPFTGVGAGYAVNDKLSFSVQYQGAFYLIAGVGQMTGGLQYRF
jgi:hypothetical protein